MQIHTEFREIPGKICYKNTAEFRGILCVFQKIPYSAGSEKSTSVDTLVMGLNKPTTTNVKCQENLSCKPECDVEGFFGGGGRRGGGGVNLPMPSRN
jgi:hypothetical protein